MLIFLLDLLLQPFYLVFLLQHLPPVEVELKTARAMFDFNVWLTQLFQQDD